MTDLSELELIVHPVSAIVFQAEPASADIMNRPPRDPAAPLLPSAAVMRSAVSGAVLAVASFAMYWWHWQSLGEAQARASSLIVLLAGYQTLISAERPALPALLERIPRTLVFWTVWAASTVSLLMILYIPAAAQMFRVEHPPGVHVAVAILLGVLAVGGGCYLGRHSCGVQAIPNRSREPGPPTFVRTTTRSKAAVQRAGARAGRP